MLGFVQEMPAAHEARIRRTSKLLFGNADRLTVAAAVAAPERTVVSASEVGKELSLAHSRVWRQLRTLAEAGLLEELPRSGIAVHYLKRESPFWALVLSLLQDIGQEPGA